MALALLSSVPVCTKRTLPLAYFWEASVISDLDISTDHLWKFALLHYFFQRVICKMYLTCSLNLLPR